MTRFFGKRSVGLLILLLAAAGWWLATPAPLPATPALWRVDGPQGQYGYLFGTIHALPRPALWRGAKVADALKSSDALLVEVAQLNDAKGLADSFQALAHAAGQPPLDARVRPDLGPALAAALAKAGRRAADFADTKTWAAALMLARTQEPAGNPAYGVDRALEAEKSLPVAELEGARQQFAAFDALPEAAQRSLLAQVVAPETKAADLATAWRQGDMATLAKATHEGMLADPTLREALYVARNRAWVAAITAALRQNRHPFVAVGAAHMAGDQGLPALLAAQGWRITRVQ